MERRGLLRLLGGAGLAGLAGCTGRRVEPTPTPRPGGVEQVAGTTLPVPQHDLRLGGLRDAIPAIIEPAFGEDWAGLTVEYRTAAEVRASGTIEPRLAPEDRVIGVVRGGEARAYPLRVLDWHEVVNDDLAGPLLVTYCPLCRSGIVAERTLDGEPARFGVSGWLWNSALVMYDVPTDSLWSQIAATAIRGQLTGERLSLVPSTITTWAAWREAHPEGRVLLPPPRSNTVRGPVGFDYTADPYADYRTSRRMGIGQNAVPDHGVDLHPKAQVLGVTAGGRAKAYPLEVVRGAGPLNDAVGGVPVVVAAAGGGATAVAYVRRVDGETMAFEAGPGSTLAAGGSRWRLADGRAVDGPHAGTTLRPATEVGPMFWFAWLDFHPETAVYGGA